MTEFEFNRDGLLTNLIDVCGVAPQEAAYLDNLLMDAHLATLSRTVEWLITDRSLLASMLVHIQDITREFGDSCWAGNHVLHTPY